MHIVALLLMGAGTFKAEAANKLSPAEIAAGGWESLFDGVSTSQWTVDNPKKWIIDDSAMKSVNTGAMLYSVKEYADFEWRVDFKVNLSGNSGFFIRTKNDWYCDGFEVAILDSKEGGDADERSDPANGDKLPAGIPDLNTGRNFTAGSDAPIKRSGAIYDIYPTTKDGITIPKGGVYVDRMRPAMVWNSLVIWANGNNIETWLNGMKVTDFTIGSPDYIERYKRSKFSPGCGDQTKVPPEPLFGKKNAAGKLVVQDHGGDLYVWMRNVKVRPINTSAALPKPLITPNGGAFNGTTKVTLDAGMTAYIRYTLDGSDPTESSPLYNDSSGIVLNKSGATTLTAKTFRPGFTTSPASSATFSLSGTSLITDRTEANPGADFSYSGERLRLLNRNGAPAVLDVIDLKGGKVKSLPVQKSATTIGLSGLKSGVYLIRMHGSGWLRTGKIIIP